MPRLPPPFANDYHYRSFSISSLVADNCLGSGNREKPLWTYFSTYLSPREVNQFNNGQSYLLPMAFPEGSPMHPSYGAGHATVAGACVTILKAFFDHGWQFPDFSQINLKAQSRDEK